MRTTTLALLTTGVALVPEATAISWWTNPAQEVLCVVALRVDPACDRVGAAPELRLP